MLLYMPLCAGICHPAPSTLSRSRTGIFYWHKTQVVTEMNEISWYQQNSWTIMGYTCRILKDSRCFQKWCNQWAHCYQLQRNCFGEVSMESHVNGLITGGQKKYCLKFLITLGEWSTVEETKMCKHEPFLVRHIIYTTIIMNVWLFKIIFIEERGKYVQLLWSWRVQCEETNESRVLGKLTY
jgi:hypothetical protein